MLLDRKHRSWSIATAAAIAAATGVYAAYPRLSERAYTGGSWVGLLFGVCAAAAMVFAGLLAVRKAIPLAPVGSAQFWLRGHIWIGLLSGPLALYHASFRLGGPVEMLLMVCFAVVLVSGVFGLAMQQILPRLLKVRVPLETFAEQIPYLCRRFRAEGDFLIAQFSGKVDVDFESLRDEAFQFALAEGELRNGREQEDFAKFLAGVYQGAPDGGAGSPRKIPKKAGSQSTDASPHGAANRVRAGASSPAKKSVSVQDKLALAKAAGTAKKTAASTEAPIETISEDPSATDNKLSVQEKMAKARAAIAARKARTDSEDSNTAEKKLSIQEKLAQAKAAGTAKLKAAPDKPKPMDSAAGTTEARVKPPLKPAASGKAGAQALLEKLAKQGKPGRSVAPKPKKPTPDEPLPRTEELRSFYLDEIRPFLSEEPRRVRRHAFADETTARMRFANQGRVLPDKLLTVHRRLEFLCDQRRQYLEQGRIRGWLHYWLLVHAPLSAVLFVLLAVHIVMALRVVPWEL